MRTVGTLNTNCYNTKETIVTKETDQAGFDHVTA
jgi:hypothetical protein